MVKSKSLENATPVGINTFPAITHTNDGVKKKRKWSTAAQQG